MTPRLIPLLLILSILLGVLPAHADEDVPGLGWHASGDTVANDLPFVMVSNQSGALAERAAAVAAPLILTDNGANSSLVWSLDTVPANLGGTGITSYSVGDLLYASGTTTLSKITIGAPGTALVVNGAGTGYEHAVVGSFPDASGNKFLASPADGSLGGMTQRAMVNLDVPSTLSSKTFSGCSLDGTTTVTAASLLSFVIGSGSGQLLAPADTDDEAAVYHLPDASTGNHGASTLLSQVDATGNVSNGVLYYAASAPDGRTSAVAGTSGQPLLAGNPPAFGTLGLTYGGSAADLSGATTNGVIYKAASALAGTGAGTTGQPFLAGNPPAFGTLGLTYGGSAADLSGASQGGLIYKGASALAASSAGTSGMAALSGGTGSPTFGTLGLVYGGTAADLSGATTGAVITKGASALTSVAPGTEGQPFRMGSSTAAFGSLMGGFGSGGTSGCATSGTITGPCWHRGNYATTNTITCNRCRFHVTGTVTVSHAITVNTETPGGTGADNGSTGNRGGPGAGIAGGVCLTSNAAGVGFGGGGGGYGGAGGNGGADTAGKINFGGHTYPIEAYLGGSGGAGGGSSDDPDAGGAGGAGGGGLLIEAGGNVTISANITAAGAAGTIGGGNEGGGGGGGSGGAIWIGSAGTVTISNGVTLSVAGGAGGNGGTGPSGGGGGGGGGGIIWLGGTTVTTTGATLTVSGGAKGSGVGTEDATAGSSGVTTTVTGGVEYSGY